MKFIDAKFKEITAVNNITGLDQSWEYDKLILTTGSKANELNELPFYLDNVFPLKSINNFLQIKKYISNNNKLNILIVGSGYIGLEAADSLFKIGHNVTILEKEILPIKRYAWTNLT